MQYIKKIDLIILSVLFSIIFWCIEAFIHSAKFTGQHVSSAVNTDLHPYFQELIFPDSHELYMRLLVILLMIIFGVITQFIINWQRFFAAHDSITYALNNRAMKPLISKIVSNKSYNKKGCIVLIKLNKMSLIQRALGVAQVDQVVKEVVIRLNKRFESQFIGASRFSNFIFYFKETPPKNESYKICKMFDEVFDKDFILSGLPFHMEANVGIVKLAKVRTYDEVMKLAYKALMKSYTNGNHYAMYDSIDENEDKRKVAFIGQFYSAIKQNQFLLYLQPKICCRTDKVVGFEALSRWVKPSKGVVSPDEYIDEAEKSQAIHWLTTEVIKSGLKIFKEMNLIQSDIEISFNLSANDLINQYFFNWLLNYLDKTPINPSLITFEITESAFLHQTKRAIKNINKLAQRGFKIALDDFGTGYCSYSYIKDFIVNEVKIDKVFIQDIDKNIRNQAIVKNIVLLSHEIHARICAEGVETQNELDMLKILGCDLGQGYYWSKPVPHEKAYQLIPAC